MRETLYLQPMRIGKSHVELKIEIYEEAAGLFSSAVFEKQVFLIEPAFLSGVGEESERRGMVSLFLEDPFYNTAEIRSQTPGETLSLTLEVIQKQLLSSGEKIEYLRDLAKKRRKSTREKTSEG